MMSEKVVPANNPGLERVEKDRLAKMNRRILEALETGTKTNRQLLEYTTRIGTRIYDLRQAGYRIETKRDTKSGMAWYTLIED